MEQGLQQGFIAQHNSRALGIGSEIILEPGQYTLHLHGFGGSCHHLHLFNMTEVIEMLRREFVGKLLEILSQEQTCFGIFPQQLTETSLFGAELSVIFRQKTLFLAGQIIFIVIPIEKRFLHLLEL